MDKKNSRTENGTAKAFIEITANSMPKAVGKEVSAAIHMLANPVGLSELEILDLARLISGRNYPCAWERRLGIKLRRYRMTASNGLLSMTYRSGKGYSDDLLVRAWQKYARIGVRGGEGGFTIYSLACYEDAVKLASWVGEKLSKKGMCLARDWLTPLLERYPGMVEEEASYA